MTANLQKQIFCKNSMYNGYHYFKPTHKLVFVIHLKGTPAFNISVPQISGTLYFKTNVFSFLR